MATKKKAAKKKAAPKKSRRKSQPTVFTTFTDAIPLTGLTISDHIANYNAGTNIGNIKLNFSNGTSQVIANINGATLTAMLGMLQTANKQWLNGYIVSTF